jgi:hypothetical protein
MPHVLVFRLFVQESGVPGYEQLYADDARRRTKLQQLAARPPEQATFKPKVGLVG